MGAPLEYGAPSIAIANADRSWPPSGGQSMDETYPHTEAARGAFDGGVQKDVRGWRRTRPSAEGDRPFLARRETGSYPDPPRKEAKCPRRACSSTASPPRSSPPPPRTRGTSGT